ncbi:MAG: hypothetical protein Q8934_03070 [Bacillota bacterium]|nr:hypothetical protein [Bacillota bacterium]
MSTIQQVMEAFIKDVNTDDGVFVRSAEYITNCLYFIIKWAGIPFVLYLLFEFFRM